jgi:hypothetical protein
MIPLKRVLVAVALVGALAPSTALGQGGRGGFHAGRAGKSFVVKNRIPPAPKSVFPQPVDQWRFWGTPIVKHHPGVHHPGFVGTNGFIGVPSVGVGVTVPVVNEVVDASTTIIYASPPAMPAPAFSPALAGPSMLPTPTLIEHGDGWYQLRGDGVTQPYSWVYIPKPPTAPPIEVASAPDPPARPADRGPAYHFTDDRGVTTFTNRLDRVPKRFRDQAASTAQPD